MGVMIGCQCPGAEFGTHCDGPNRPSSWRAAIMAAAAAFPALMPWRLDEPFGIAASELSYCVASDRNRAARAVASKFGTVATMSRRTPYAAVATAASFDALAAKRLCSRYGR